MLIKSLAISIYCAFSLIGIVLCAKNFQTEFPYCYIEGHIVHFGKLWKDKESCTVYKCKKGKKPVVETYKCQGLDHIMHVDYFYWCTENDCPT